MKLKRDNRPVTDVDVTSFSDLAFLLIIFFILTTTFTRPMGAKVTIPSGTSDPQKKAETEYPTINLSSTTLVFNKEPVSLEQFRRRLQNLRLEARKEEERIIVLESAPDVPFEQYLKVVTAVSKAGGILALVEVVEEDKAGKSEGGNAAGEAAAEKAAP